MAETITKDKVVELHFTLKNKAGQQIDSSRGQSPLTYLHGHRNLIPGLENALQGCKIGDKRQVTLEPKEAYGEVDEGLKMNIPLDQFPKGEKITPGMQFQGTNTDGQVIVFVVESLHSDHVTVDGNHPLAGNTLYFDVEVVGIRDATDEELTHGHVHEPGGHHH